MEINNKNYQVSDLCLKLIGKMYVNNIKTNPKNFARQIAIKELGKDANKNKIKDETTYLYPSVYKALNKLASEKKILKTGNPPIYLPYEEHIKKPTKKFLKENLKPSKKHVQKLNNGTYILTIDREKSTKIKYPKFNETYNEDISLLEDDMKKLINYITETKNLEKANKKNDEKILRNLKLFIGSSYCYDVLKVDEKIIIILDTDNLIPDNEVNLEINLDDPAGEAKKYKSEKFIIGELNKLIEEIYTHLNSSDSYIYSTTSNNRLSEEQYLKLEEKLLSNIKTEKPIRRKDVLNICHTSTYQSNQLLKNLVNKGKLELTGRGAGARYKLK